ncbi:MAG: hypothetical protein KIT56_00890 [Gammaproteobacteria bacterium]|nr:hypothetical protein [Gammaproteobacteria bacterium]MCW5582441.1 hypothetical protein [Gammaproteobacteria bacterium]
MSNLNHANDKLKAPLCDSNDDSNQFSNKMHYLNNLLRLLELSYEGFHFANNYANAEVTENHQYEGKNQFIFYLKVFDEALLSLDHISHEMHSQCDAKREGK